MEYWMPRYKRMAVGAMAVVVVVTAYLCSLLVPARLVKNCSKDPDMGSRYYSITVEYCNVAIAANIRRFAWRVSSKQRAVSEG